MAACTFTWGFEASIDKLGNHRAILCHPVTALILFRFFCHAGTGWHRWHDYEEYPDVT